MCHSAAPPLSLLLCLCEGKFPVCAITRAQARRFGEADGGDRKPSGFFLGYSIFNETLESGLQ